MKTEDAEVEEENAIYEAAFKMARAEAEEAAIEDVGALEDTSAAEDAGAFEYAYTFEEGAADPYAPIVPLSAEAALDCTLAAAALASIEGMEEGADLGSDLGSDRSYDTDDSLNSEEAAKDPVKAARLKEYYTMLEWQMREYSEDEFPELDYWKRRRRRRERELKKQQAVDGSTGHPTAPAGSRQAVSQERDERVERELIFSRSNSSNPRSTDLGVGSCT